MLFRFPGGEFPFLVDSNPGPPAVGRHPAPLPRHDACRVCPHSGAAVPADWLLDPHVPDGRQPLRRSRTPAKGPEGTGNKGGPDRLTLQLHRRRVHRHTEEVKRQRQLLGTEEQPLSVCHTEKIELYYLKV